MTSIGQIRDKQTLISILSNLESGNFAKTVRDVLQDGFIGTPFIHDCINMICDKCTLEDISKIVIETKNTELVEILEKYKKRRTEHSEKKEALSKALIALCNCKEDLIENMIKKGADPKYNNSEALRLCSENDYYENAKVLLDHDAEVSANKYEAITNAYNKPKMMKLLLKYIE